LAYDLESLVSPMLAAALLTAISFNNLFIGTVIGFLGSATLVIASRFPHTQPPPPARFLDRLSRGTRTFFASPELRGLMGLNLVVATTTAMVIVNTVVLVQGQLGRTQSDVALMLAAYGAGSMVVALGMPALLNQLADRKVMLAGGAALPIILLATAIVIGWAGGTAQWNTLLTMWVLLGAATSTILTPSARLLRRNSTEQNRPAVFAAQFSLSHACWLLTYPLAGWLGFIGLPGTALVLAVVAVVATVVAWRLWPAGATAAASSGTMLV
jgi:MFS family permease